MGDMLVDGNISVGIGLKDWAGVPLAPSLSLKMKDFISWFCGPLILKALFMVSPSFYLRFFGAV